ncbi:MAG: cytochrome c [Pseudohongiellaceae bacterium]
MCHGYCELHHQCTPTIEAYGGSSAYCRRLAEAPATSTFTEEQYESGEALYQTQCALCHGENLDDGVADSLLGQTFRNTWSRLGVNDSDLVDRISNPMPPGQLGELNETEKLEIVRLAFAQKSFEILVN